MGKNSVPVVPGATKETITHERLIVDGDEPVPGSGIDAYDYMAGLTEDEWRDHIVYIYRKFPLPANGAKRTYIAKLVHAFDDEWLKQNFGGGQYHFILKKGSQRIKEGDSSDIPGVPKNPDEAAISANQSDLVQTVKMLLEKNGGNSASTANEITAIAFKNALEIQRQSMPPPMSIADLTTALKNLNELNGGAPHAGATPEWLTKFGEALLPVGVGLIAKLLEPKDALASIKGVAEAFQMMKSISPAEPAEINMGLELVRNGPQLLGGLMNVLSELRKSEELKKAQQAVTQPALPPGVPVVPPDRVVVHHRPANGQPAAPPASVPVNEKGEPSPEFVWGKVIEMCQSGDDGKFAFDWLDTIDPQAMGWLRSQNFSLDQLKGFIATGAIHEMLVKGLIPLPGYNKFIAEFHTALMAPAAVAAA